MNSYKYVILGGGVAAGYAAREFVDNGLRPFELCILSGDDLLPYERPPLSKGFLAGEKSREDLFINDPKFYSHHGIDVYLNTWVTRLDLKSRILHTSCGKKIGFEKLLIATGSRPRKLDIPNAQLKGIFYLRWYEDAMRILDAYETGAVKQVVVVGGGFIGMEASAVLASQGLDVTLVYPEERLMERLFTPAMSLFFEKYFRERGVSLLSNSKPVRFIGQEHLEGVMLNTGDVLPADAMVMGIGVEPATGMLQGTILNLQNDEGVVVNKYLETNLPGIYAAGDVANYFDTLNNKRQRIEHWQNAVEQGKHAARTMITGKREMFMHIPYFFSDVFDLSYEFWGDTEGYDQVVHRGDLANGSFSVWWLREEAVIAAFVMNQPREERELAPEWIRTHHRPRITITVLQDAGLPLRELDRMLVV